VLAGFLEASKIVAGAEITRCKYGWIAGKIDLQISSIELICKYSSYFDRQCISESQFAAQKLDQPDI
jgi:hypothetical protein